MLIDHDTLSGIERGLISLAFRRWRRPTVKSGGTLLTSVGQLAIESVDRIELESISEADATQAGFADLGALQAALEHRPQGELYRIRLRFIGPDPRVALRKTIPEGKDLEALIARLRRMDARSQAGPWTRRTMELIQRRPGVRAGDLAIEVSMERGDFKARVRKLKGLGLTESLKVGYRLSARGAALLPSLEDPASS